MLLSSLRVASVRGALSRGSTGGASIRCLATVGDKVPSVDLYQKFPPEKVNLAEYCANKSVLLVGLPAAFTPT